MSDKSCPVTPKISKNGQTPRYTPSKQATRAQIRMEFIPSPRTNSRTEVIERNIENLDTVRMTSKVTLGNFGDGNFNSNSNRTSELDLDLATGTTGDVLTPLTSSSSKRFALVKYDKAGLTEKTSDTNLTTPSTLDTDRNFIENEEFPRGFTFIESALLCKHNNLGSASETIISEGSEVEPLMDHVPNYVFSRNLSIITDYDELVKLWKSYSDKKVVETFLEFAEHQELCRLEWLRAVQECRRLQNELDNANHEIGDFQAKLKSARKLLDQERKLRRKAEDERSVIEQQMYSARELLFNEQQCKISDDTKEKLSFLNASTSSNNRGSTILDRNIALLGNRLDTINEVNSGEINSTGSLLSDYSCSRSDAEIDNSTIQRMKIREWKVPAAKKNTKSPRRQIAESSQKVVEIHPTDKIVATTTLQMTKDGPITATSIIEAVPQSESETSQEFEREQTPPREEEKSPRDKTPSPPIITSRSHNFISKAVICPDTCALCKSRIRFGKIVVKCKDCRATCHIECKNLLPLPCIPLLNLATTKSTVGTLSDYSPNTAPMVPAIIVNCINEIELRGLKEVGLYRIPGVEKDIKTLKDKLLRIKTIPNLRGVEIHVLCGVVKDFLRSLKEPLVTFSLRRDFIQASEAKEEVDAISCMYQAISQLPQPNRDTLAYVMLHLNRVAASRDCRMPSSNLAKIFGPAIIGYSSNETAGTQLLCETKQQNLVMTYLMRIPVDFWSSFVILDSAASTPRSTDLLRTPSSSSTITRRYFTPQSSSSSSSGRKRKKYFGTPPSCKK